MLSIGDKKVIRKTNNSLCISSRHDVTTAPYSRTYIAIRIIIETRSDIRQRINLTIIGIQDAFGRFGSPLGRLARLLLELSRRRKGDAARRRRHRISFEDNGFIDNIAVYPRLGRASSWRVMGGASTGGLDSLPLQGVQFWKATGTITLGNVGLACATNIRVLDCFILEDINVSHPKY